MQKSNRNTPVLATVDNPNCFHLSVIFLKGSSCTTCWRSSDLCAYSYDRFLGFPFAWICLRQLAFSWLAQASFLSNLISFLHHPLLTRSIASPTVQASRGIEHLHFAIYWRRLLVHAFSSSFLFPTKNPLLFSIQSSCCLFEDRLYSLRLRHLFSL